MDGLNFNKDGTVTDHDGNHVGSHNGFEATEFFEREFKTLEEIEEALQKGIYEGHCPYRNEQERVATYNAMIKETMEEARQLDPV